MPNVSFNGWELDAVTECCRDRRDRRHGMYAMLHKSNPKRLEMENEEQHLTAALTKFHAAKHPRKKREVTQ